MTTEFEKISDVADFQYKQLGYVDVNLLTKMTGIPHFAVHKILAQCGWKESEKHDQYFKPQFPILFKDIEID